MWFKRKVEYQKIKNHNTKHATKIYKDIEHTSFPFYLLSTKLLFFKKHVSYNDTSSCKLTKSSCLRWGEVVFWVVYVKMRMRTRGKVKCISLGSDGVSEIWPETVNVYSDWYHSASFLSLKVSVWNVKTLCSKNKEVSKRIQCVWKNVASIS